MFKYDICDPTNRTRHDYSLILHARFFVRRRRRCCQVFPLLSPSSSLDEQVQRLSRICWRAVVRCKCKIEDQICTKFLVFTTRVSLSLSLFLHKSVTVPSLALEGWTMFGLNCKPNRNLSIWSCLRSKWSGLVFFKKNYGLQSGPGFLIFQTRPDRKPYFDQKP